MAPMAWAPLICCLAAPRRVMNRPWRRGRHTDTEAVARGVRVHRQRCGAARPVIGAVIGTGGWSATDLLPGRPMARDEQAVANTGRHNLCHAAGMDA